MQQILLVGLGGCLGSIARYQLSGLVLHHTLEWRFPLPTFLINVIGCLVAGVLSGLIERYGWFSPNTRLLLFTGILGGFTTFSAFGVETAYLLKRGEVVVAFAYVGLSVLCGLGALLLAMKAVP
jgi:fluoride exporter